MDAELREALNEIRGDIKGLLPLKDAVDRHEVLLYGNGHDGLLTRLDKVQERQTLYAKIMSGIGTAVMGLFGDLAWRHIK